MVQFCTCISVTPCIYNLNTYDDDEHCKKYNGHFNKAL